MRQAHMYYYRISVALYRVNERIGWQANEQKSNQATKQPSKLANMLPAEQEPSYSTSKQTNKQGKQSIKKAQTRKRTYRQRKQASQQSMHLSGSSKRNIPASNEEARRMIKSGSRANNQSSTHPHRSTLTTDFPDTHT